MISKGLISAGSEYFFSHALGKYSFDMLFWAILNTWFYMNLTKKKLIIQKKEGHSIGRKLQTVYESIFY